MFCLWRSSFLFSKSYQKRGLFRNQFSRKYFSSEMFFCYSRPLLRRKANNFCAVCPLHLRKCCSRGKSFRSRENQRFFQTLWSPNQRSKRYTMTGKRKSGKLVFSYIGTYRVVSNSQICCILLNSRPLAVREHIGRYKRKQLGYPYI